MHTPKIPILLAFGLLLPASLPATVIDVDGDPALFLDNGGNPEDELAYLEGALGFDLTYLLKFETDGNGLSEDPGIGIYTFDDGGNVTTDTVSCDLTGTDGFILSYILLKDGNLPMGDGIYNLYQVTTDMGIS